MKIGVYICHCGTNIAKTVDVQKVVDTVGKHPRVKVSKHYEYMCSEPGQQLIKEDIRREKLDRIVVASCSPRMHEPTFRNVVEEAGLNPYCFEMVNIREQCSWVHKEKKEATRKALELVLAGVSRAVELESLERKEISVIPQATVIGGGIAGMQAALDIADRGFKVYLVERSPSIGGRMAQLDKTFPTLDCSACILTPKMVDVKWHPNIELLTYSEVESVEGYVGNFKVKVKRKPRYIDEEKCTGCDECTEVCPVSVPSEFEMGLAKRKAIYRPFPQAVPNVFTIEKKGISPCKAECPADVDVQGYIALIKEGKYEEAVELHRKKNPFPSICGRVCHRPCENECLRKEVDEAVSIKLLKRFVADQIRGKEKKQNKIKPAKRKKVAIIGAGPSGLTCALRLLEKGYPVTVFDSAEKPGGMLSSCIPDYRITGELVDYEISQILDRGVKLECGKKVGKDIRLDELRKKYTAVYMAIGAQKAKKMPVEGADVDHVYLGLDFLREVKSGQKIDLGKKVIVIGGGNVAIDCAKNARRLGVDEVSLVCLETRDLSSKDRMPAHDWEIEEAEEEGIKIHDSLGTKRILSEKNKFVGIETNVCTSVYDENGKFAPKFEADKTSILKADTLIITIGQECDLEGFKSLETTPWGTIKIDENTLETSLKGVFAGGDVVRGPASVVEAVGDGNKAADSIDRYLKGEAKPLEEKPHVVSIEEVDIGLATKIKRIPQPKAPSRERIRDFREIELGLSEEEALREAERCMNCAVCSGCGQCEEACEAEAVIRDQKEESIELEVGAIVVATGFDPFNPSQLSEYGYGKYPEVITGLEFERLSSASGPTGGEIMINGKKPKRVAFFSCVGSRKKETNPYCSRVCCMYTAKQAHLAKEKLPEAEVTVYYSDIRAFGKGYEEFYNRVKDEGVEYKRRELDDEIKVSKKSDILVVEAKPHEPEEVDLVVLASAIIPSSGTRELARVLNVSQGPDGFFLEAHPKLRPVDTFSDGIFLAGCAQSPKDIPDTVAQASASAAEVCALLTKGKVTAEGIVASVNENLCSGCGFCVEVCPVNAIELVSMEKEKITSKIAKVNEALCKGCGICCAACLSGAIQQRHFEDKQILPLIDALGG